jgi:hypothetical protein
LKRLAFLFLSTIIQSCFLFEKEPKHPVIPEPVVDKLPEFIVEPTVVLTGAGKTTEASGIAPAYNSDNCIWVVEDSGNEAGVHLLGADGQYKSFVSLPLQNRDWEDMATGPGPIENKKYIYLADIGDNNLKHNEYTIYRFEEPPANEKSVNLIESIKFTYPGSSPINAETILLDPTTKDIYIISKDQLNVQVYKLPYPQSTNAVTEAQFLGAIPYLFIVGGDISPDGTEILLKSYVSVFYWKLKKDESIFQALSRTRDIGAPYVQENQGEAICWSKNAKGYFTLSEMLDSPEPQKLYFYSKK